jgi:hypothetical protein
MATGRDGDGFIGTEERSSSKNGYAWEKKHFASAKGGRGSPRCDHRRSLACDANFLVALGELHARLCAQETNQSGGIGGGEDPAHVKIG